MSYLRRRKGLHSPMPASAVEVGGRLRELRESRGLTQRELAGDDLTGAYVSRIEAGERNPSVEVLRLFAGRLGVSVEYLEVGVDPPDLARALRLVAAARCRFARGDEGGGDRLLERAYAELAR